MNYTALAQLVFLAFGVSMVSVTITKTKIFEPFRDWLNYRTDWLYELFSCPYCLSVWVSMGTVAIFRPFVLSDFHVSLNYPASVFAMVSVAAIVTGIKVKLLQSED